jgi:hypothetical protein
MDLREVGDIIPKPDATDGLDCVLINNPPPPPPNDEEGVVGVKMNGVALCEELLVRRDEGVKMREEARASALGLDGPVEGGVMVVV